MWQWQEERVETSAKSNAIEYTIVKIIPLFCKRLNNILKIEAQKKEGTKVIEEISL